VQVSGWPTTLTTTSDCELTTPLRTSLLPSSALTLHSPSLSSTRSNQVPGLEVYTITGIGVSDFENPALELIAGVGVEYEIKSFVVFGEYQYNSEDEDSVARLGIGITF
jgi:hypothetical protein